MLGSKSLILTIFSFIKVFIAIILLVIQLKKLYFIIFLLILLIFSYKIYENKYAPQYSNEDFDIDNYISLVDADDDGIDDQSDILLSAKEYLETNPEYKSVYYETGYSTDNYGVCTDVVAKALLNSGYDLMYLVNEDIISNYDVYDLDDIDINIDFRRVVNLYVYFENTAISLTTDVNELSEWQGGDIVVFEEHIAIVSDRRDESGIVFILHHSDPYQIFYEESILEINQEIIGHYRIS